VSNIQKAGTKLLGAENVVDATRSDLNKLVVAPPDLNINLGYPWDDGALLSAKAPDAAFFYLGVRSDRTGPINLHTPNFNPDEKAFEIGSAVLAEATLRWMEE
jgi:metal-dependent amidase/aminoacylase/carboxypeptidase family protein